MTHKHVRSYRTNKFRVGSATRLVVRGIVVKLASSAFVDWAFVDENQKEYESGNTQLSGEDYQAWGDDDEYVYNWLATELGATIVNIEPN